MKKTIDPNYLTKWLEDHPDVDAKNLYALTKLRDEYKTGVKVCEALMQLVMENPAAGGNPMDVTIVSIVNLKYHTKGRLAETLSATTFGKIAAENVTIRNLIESVHDLSTLPALTRGSYTPMFSPGVVEKIKSVLKKDYSIDYDAEHANFLAQHTGLSAFIWSLDIPEWPRNSIVRALGSHNATLRDLLMSRKDLRDISGIGIETEKKLLSCFQDVGVDYHDFRNN